jgi:H/ACA ribonucleoprotein complex subunit 2
MLPPSTTYRVNIMHNSLYILIPYQHVKIMKRCLPHPIADVPGNNKFVGDFSINNMADDDDQNDAGGYEEKVRCFHAARFQSYWFIYLFHLDLIQVKFVSAIAKPLASKKTTKKLHKLVKKASQAKFVRRGVKEVVKALRKGSKGFCIIAGDISPIDVVVHLPVMCEDRRIPYFYVPSKLDLGAAASTKRPTSCILVTPKDTFSEMSLYDKLFKEAQEALVQFQQA